VLRNCSEAGRKNKDLRTLIKSRNNKFVQESSLHVRNSPLTRG
jgi:hypothetical protein